MGCTYCQGPVDVGGVEVCAECFKVRGELFTKLSNEVIDAYALALAEHASEHLAGNAVKEAYWSGELVALRRMADFLNLDVVGS